MRVARYLERAGLVERDVENSYLTESASDNSEMLEHQIHSINYRISIGHQKGKKIFSLQTMPPIFEERENVLLGKLSGFSLHAGVSIKAHERKKLERICRYIARPSVS